MDLEHERTLARSALEALAHSTTDLEEYVHAVAPLAAERIAPGTSTSITVRRAGEATSVASSDVTAELCDEVEYLAGEGPCLASMDAGAVLVVPRIDTETRWPSWREASTLAGFASSAAVPRRIAHDFDVALDLYAREPDVWDRAALARAEVYTEVLARTLDMFVRAGDAPRLATELRAAIAARATIDQAVGIVMVHEGGGPQDALARLEASALERGSTLRAEAARVVGELGP
ncbi:ANTAR domain-containing protein [Cellulomonas cellasea]|uniref:ANTAR domain-containing protein n=1 Tax=Cellulomonas cellasea TaxID=43670 RepID=A0A7W4UI63_9CELL|nr:ANTAR domain-containing protein [Cellulomonas cellasea]MBB2924617.1 hypothetical protein [Cellulomonas cellasea]